VPRIPFRLPNSEKSPRLPAERREVRRRQLQASSAALLIARSGACVGLPVIPLAPGNKRSVTPHGGDDATTDAGQIWRWWTRWTTVNHHRKRTEVGDRIRVARACASVLVSGGAS